MWPPTIVLENFLCRPVGSKSSNCLMHGMPQIDLISQNCTLLQIAFMHTSFSLLGWRCPAAMLPTCTLDYVSQLGFGLCCNVLATKPLLGAPKPADVCIPFSTSAHQVS